VAETNRRSRRPLVLTHPDEDLDRFPDGALRAPDVTRGALRTAESDQQLVAGGAVGGTSELESIQRLLPAGRRLVIRESGRSLTRRQHAVPKGLLRGPRLGAAAGMERQSGSVWLRIIGPDASRISACANRYAPGRASSMTIRVSTVVSSGSSNSSIVVPSACASTSIVNSSPITEAAVNMPRATAGKRASRRLITT
jgi:hypothetical protein